MCDATAGPAAVACCSAKASVLPDGDIIRAENDNYSNYRCDEVDELKQMMEQLLAQHESLLVRMTALERQQAPVVQNNSMDSQPEAFEHVLELEPTKLSPVPREMKAMTAQVVDDEAMADGEAMTDSLLNSSFWDALTVVGLPQVGMTTSCLLAMGAVLSIVIQGAFVQILYESFLAPDAKYDASFLADWRLLAGHAAQGYDATSKSSLVSRMCNGKPFDREWWVDALLQEIDAYLQPFIFEAPTGSVLSSICIAVWLAHIFQEIRLVIQLMVAILYTTRGNTCLLDMGYVGGRMQRRFKSMSWTRCSLISLIALFRCALAALLGVSGAIWLGRTRDIDDIIQNAVALVFILEIDELFFEIFGPHHAKLLVSSIAAPKLRRTRPQNNLVSFSGFLFFWTMVSLLVFLEVFNNAEAARSVQRAMCGGNVDFLIESHPHFGPILVQDTTPYTDDGSALQNKLLKGILPLLRAVAEEYKGQLEASQFWVGVLEGDGVPREVTVKHLVKEEPSESLPSWLAMDHFDIAQEDTIHWWFTGVGCHDTNATDASFEMGMWLWSTVETLTGATTCSEARFHCNNVSMVLVRLLCPETCGCTRPDSGQYHSWGCLHSCTQEPSFKNYSLCHDFREDELDRKARWELYWQNSEWAQYPDWNCSFLEDDPWGRFEFCFNWHSSQDQRRPITAFCPELCGCFEDPQPTLDDPAVQVHGMWCPEAC